MPVDPLHRIPDWNAGASEVFKLPTPPDKFPRGRYLLRVEVHRRGQELHHAWHQTQIYIDR